MGARAEAEAGEGTEKKRLKPKRRHIHHSVVDLSLDVFFSHGHGVL